MMQQQPQQQMFQQPQMSADDMRMARFRQIVTQHEIRPDYAAKLKQLVRVNRTTNTTCYSNLYVFSKKKMCLLMQENFEIVLLCDDSGSMGTVVDAGPGQNPFAKSKTRWSELCQYVRAHTLIYVLYIYININVFYIMPFLCIRQFVTELNDILSC